MSSVYYVFKIDGHHVDQPAGPLLHPQHMFSAGISFILSSAASFAQSTVTICVKAMYNTYVQDLHVKTLQSSYHMV